MYFGTFHSLLTKKIYISCMATVFNLRPSMKIYAAFNTQFNIHALAAVLAIGMRYIKVKQK